MGPPKWLSGQRVRWPMRIQETWVWSLGQKDSLEQETAAHSTILPWKISWTEEPGGLYSPWGHKELNMTEYIKNLESWVKRVFHHVTSAIGKVGKGSLPPFPKHSPLPGTKCLSLSRTKNELWVPTSLQIWQGGCFWFPGTLWRAGVCVCVSLGVL